MSNEPLQSFTSMREGLNREGAYLQFLLEKGGLLEMGLNRTFAVVNTWVPIVVNVNSSSQ